MADTKPVSGTIDVAQNEAAAAQPNSQMTPPAPQSAPPQAPDKAAPAGNAGVVFTNNQQAPAAPSGDIPEEYLTDEDLYPVATDQSSLSATAKKKTPLIIIAVVGLLVVFGTLIVLLGLLSRKPAAPGKVTLTYWGLWETEQVMNQIISEYQIQHPNVTVEYKMMDAKDNYLQRLLERTKKGTGPDIFRYHNTWVPQLKQVLSAAPETVMTAADFKNIFYPVIAKDLTVGTSVVGMPLGIDGLVLLYNDKIMKAAGFAAPPKDWEELLNMVQPGKGITVKDQQGTIITSGIALGSAENVSHFSDIISLMFLQNGVSMKSFTANQNAQSVLMTYTDAVTSPNKFWDETFEPSLLAFAHEKVAMIFAPSWEIEVVRRLNPDLEFKVARVPQIKGGAQKGLASYWVEGVSRSSAHQAEAWNFLKYMTEKETLTKLYETTVKSGRMFGYPYPRVDMAALLLQDPYAGPIIADAPIMDSLPLTSSTYDNGMDDRLINYLKDAINGTLNGSTVEGALNTMDKGFMQVYQDFQVTFP